MSGPAPKDITGLRFHKLVAIEIAEVRNTKFGKVRRWLCRCDCGNNTIVAQPSLTGTAIKSCGCIRGKHKRTHGATGTPEFRIWSGMKRRCLSPNHHAYAKYGGRGIKVCERWEKSFENFLADMGPRPSPRHSLDRYPDNDGHYEPGNCRWATMREQGNNRRSSRRIEFRGEARTASEWERHLGLKAGIVARRLSKGWAVERALTEPKKVQKARNWRAGNGSAPHP